MSTTFSSMKSTDVKNQNKVSILRYVYTNGVTSRTDLVNGLGLSKPTVSLLVEELVREGYLCGVGMGNSKVQGGKPPKLFDFYAQRGAAIAVSIGISRIHGALVDLKLNVWKQMEVRYDKGQAEPSLATVSSVVRHMLQEAEQASVPVFGIGVSVPGIVQSKLGTLVNAAHLEHWSNIPIGPSLQEQFRLPVRVDNATRNIALAEKWAGLGQPLSTFITVQTVGGLGTGIFLNGTIYQGPGDSGGEFGHTTIDFNGPLCNCGNRGCWELYASHDALMKQIADSLAAGSSSLLAKRLNAGEPLDLKLLSECCSEGDAFSEQQVKRYAMHMGVGIVNLVNVFNPEMIILQGHLMLLGQSFLDEIRAVLDKRAIASGAKFVRLAFSNFKEETKIIGAAALIVKDVMEGKFFQG